MEVVFVSSDRDEAAFKEYFAEQPWLALPYAERDLKEKLSKKYKVQGIPSLVILDEDGGLITKEGRAAVSGDPKGEKMPWIPKTLPQIMEGAMVVNQDGAESPLAEATAGKVTAFYFSAHWCPPCRGFTPQLAKWYTDDLKEKGLEVVFVSSDRDEVAFKEYFAEQPWLALSYGDHARKEELSNYFGVRGIPSLVIMNAQGEVITKDGRGAISSDPKGLEFPWTPKPVSNLKAGPGNINEVTTVLCFCEKSGEEAQGLCEATMTPLAEKYNAQAKAEGEEDPKFAFVMVSEADDLATRLRAMMKMEASDAVQMMICDIPDQGGYYKGPTCDGALTAEVLDQLMADYESKKLERQQLE